MWTGTIRRALLLLPTATEVCTLTWIGISIFDFFKISICQHTIISHFILLQRYYNPVDTIKWLKLSLVNLCRHNLSHTQYMNGCSYMCRHTQACACVVAYGNRGLHIPTQISYPRLTCVPIQFVDPAGQQFTKGTQAPWGDDDNIWVTIHTYVDN